MFKLSLQPGQIIAVGAGLVFGLAGGKLLFSPVQQIEDTVKQKKEQSSQPEIVHSPQTVTLERQTGTQKPKMEKSSIPGTVKRFSKIVVQPVNLDPITVEIVESEGETGTRTTAGATNATITGGVETVAPIRYTKTNLHWSTHILAKWNRDGKQYGIMQGYEHNRMQFNVGLYPTSQEVFCSIGVKW